MNRIIGTVLCLAFALAGPATAQRLSPAAALLEAQPPATRTVLTRLDLLNHIPAEDWHIHVGDLPHGEDPALDDSAWPLVHKGNKTGFDSVWYRRWVEIPKSLNGYDLTGARIWFSFDASANGPMPEIFYYNGRRVALGEDLEPIMLTEHAVPGDRILVAVKLQHTVDVKTFYGAGLRVDVAAPRPSPEDLRREILTAAALVPSLSRSVGAEQALLHAAVGESGPGGAGCRRPGAVRRIPEGSGTGDAAAEAYAAAGDLLRDRQRAY